MILINDVLEELVKYNNYSFPILHPIYQSDNDIGLCKIENKMLPECAYKFQNDGLFDFEWNEELEYHVIFALDSRISFTSKEIIKVYVPINLDRKELTEFLVKGYTTNNVFSLGVNTNKEIYTETKIFREGFNKRYITHDKEPIKNIFIFDNGIFDKKEEMRGIEI